MSGAKETPRQKMIGMMYLVYTALLAMNVSKDILDAFDTVNTGVQETNITLMHQISQTYFNFEEQYKQRPEKFGPNWEQAQELRARTTSIINYIEAMKWELVSTIEKKSRQTDAEFFADAVKNGLLKSADTVQYDGRLLFNVNTSKIKSRDNYNRPTEFMMGNPPEYYGKAFALADSIRAYRAEIVKIMGTEHIHELGLITDTQYSAGDSIGTKIDYAPEASDDLQKGWEYHNFHHTVLIADVTLLNKIISEIETAELNAVTFLAQDVTATDFTFENVHARAFAESSNILSGQPYKAQAMVIASQNSQITAKVKLDGQPEKEYISNSQGVIDLNFEHLGVGKHRYEGTIELFDPKSKEITEYTFENEFTVTPPMMSVSAVNMNVVYAGIDNPIAIGGGVGGAVTATATGATLTPKGNGNYNLRVNGNPKEVVVHVSSEGQSLGSMTFRVKELPKPTAKIDNVVDGKVSSKNLIDAGSVKVEMGKDFFFDGIRYDVVGYTVKYQNKKGLKVEIPVDGSKFNETLKTAIREANQGTIFVFTAIRVKGNDGIVKVLDSQLAVEIK